ncbi:MAG: regulatory protein RecX [Gemmatimonadaceae bacterium]
MIPSRITALREHPRRAGRYVIELDGEPLGAVSADSIAELGLASAPAAGLAAGLAAGQAAGLAVGQTVDAALRARLEAAVRRVACYDKALDALARRARSRADLGRWLKQREFSAEEIDPALERLESLGLLNDEEFARGFARTRLAVGRGFGPRRVAAELARRGVARALVDRVLAEHAADEGADELTAIRALVAKRSHSLAGLDPVVARRRLYGYLARRGFSPGLIRQAVKGA